MSKEIAPNNPPLLAEDALNDAEKKVLKAFREGWEDGERQVIVLPGVSGTSSVEEFIKRLKLDATLRAHFLRSLFLGSYDKFPPRSVMISCAWIEGGLNLDYCESCFPLEFSQCIFSEGISLRAATVPKLALTNCWVAQDGQGFSLSAPKMKVAANVSLNHQFTAYGEVALNGANIGGQLLCDGGRFEKGLVAQSLRTGEDVFLSEGFKSNGEVDLSGADIVGQLACVSGYFGDALIAQNLKVGKGVLLRGEFKSNGEVNLSGADIVGQLDCTGGHFGEGLIAQNLKASKGVLLRGKFKSNGEVDLSDADIVGQLDCTGGYFEKDLTAQNLKTSASVFLQGEFKSNGKVDLNGANIGGQLSCAGGHFENGLTAQSMKTGANAFLSGEFKSNGEVDILGADIGGQLICIDGHFEKGLKAQNLKTGEGVFLRRGFKSNGRVDLHCADISGVLDCTGTYFEKGLVADGLRYERIELGGNWEKGLAWLSGVLESEKEFFPQPYEQLMEVYRRMGKPDWAREIGFKLEEKRHKQSKGLWHIWHSILNWTIGYGYKPFRSLSWAIGLPLVGTILFSACTQNLSSKFTSCGSVPAFLANEWIPSDGKALEHWGQKKRAPQDYPEFQPFIYSVEATFPVLPLGQLDKWHPNNPRFRWVRWILTITGSVFLPILVLFGKHILAPTGRAREIEAS